MTRRLARTVYLSNTVQLFRIAGRGPVSDREQAQAWRGK
jgi:hypothetical protein